MMHVDAAPAMTASRVIKWIAGIFLALILLAVVLIAIFGWNWLRSPIERIALEKTGRVLAIHGDLTIKFAWPFPHLRTSAVTFANPDWAREKQMATADAVDITIDLVQLLRQNIVLPEVRLEHPVIFLEQAPDGRKNWLLDIKQQDEAAQIRIDRLMLDRGKIGYDDAAQKTSIRSELSTEPPAEPAASNTKPTGTGINFSAEGQYKGLPLKAHGSSGPVLGLRDEKTPYPLKIDLSVGRTSIKAKGTITSLLQFTAVDMRLALRGDSLAQLYLLLGIALPETHAYAAKGHIVHSKKMWRYEKFSGRIGDSDIAGNVEVDTGGKRPALKAELVSRLLDLADLGPLIGAQSGRLDAAQQAALQPKATTASTPRHARVLPDLPFNTDRWGSVDAEVTLKAATIRRAKELPLEALDTHLSLRDSVLTLDPLNFGLAGGQLDTVISLDGRKDPIVAHARVRAKKIFIAKLFPTVDLNKNSIGQINGELDLDGTGDSVSQMLASANGKLGLVIADGEVSQLMMEKVGLHLWEILALNVTGDKLVKLRCGVADFDVKQGVMRTDALIFDTEITTIIATGNIDLAQEKLNLTLQQKTKDTSPVALRSPIYVRGTFANPRVEVSKGRVAARGLGAIALGIASPVLALLPLIDAGPGKDSDCGQLVRDARALPNSAQNKP
jgi:AsmA protein